MSHMTHRNTFSENMNIRTLVLEQLQVSDGLNTQNLDYV